MVARDATRSDRNASFTSNADTIPGRFSATKSDLQADDFI